MKKLPALLVTLAISFAGMSQAHAQSRECTYELNGYGGPSTIVKIIPASSQCVGGWTIGTSGSMRPTGAYILKSSRLVN